jgi:hypothetical protein
MAAHRIEPYLDRIEPYLVRNGLNKGGQFERAEAARLSPMPLSRPQSIPDYNISAPMLGECLEKSEQKILDRLVEDLPFLTPARVEEILAREVEAVAKADPKVTFSYLSGKLSVNGASTDLGRLRLQPGEVNVYDTGKSVAKVVAPVAAVIALCPRKTPEELLDCAGQALKEFGKTLSKGESDK